MPHRSLARPPGVSSRLRRAPGSTRRRWRAANGEELELPVILDLVHVDERTGEETWRVEATVDVVDGAPALVHVELHAAGGLDTLRLQPEFRWMTPIDAVGRIAPAMLADGRDPFEQDFPFTGYPTWHAIATSSTGVSPTSSSRTSRLSTSRGVAGRHNASPTSAGCHAGPWSGGS